MLSSTPEEAVRTLLLLPLYTLATEHELLTFFISGSRQQCIASQPQVIYPDNEYRYVKDLTNSTSLAHHVCIYT